MTNKFAAGEPVTESNPEPEKMSGLWLKDASIASATGASQVIVTADPDRDVLNISNPDASISWWINESGGVAVANGAGCFELQAGQRWTPSPAPRNAVTGISTAATKLSVAVG